MNSQSLTVENISHITADFWATMTTLSLHLVPASSRVTTPEEGVSGRIEIRGAWSGAVELRATRRLAACTAASLLEKQPDEVSMEECFDAIQEATNIVAGGIKRLLPPICKMAIPEMSDCTNLLPRTLRSSALVSSFHSAIGDLSVIVLPNRSEEA